jgi:hypothetical protein
MCPKDFSTSSAVDMPSTSADDHVVIDLHDDFKQFKDNPNEDIQELLSEPSQERPCSSSQADEEHSKRLKL